MATILYPLLIAFALFISEAHSLSVVNNVPFTSDVLSDLFFNEIRTNKDLRAAVSNRFADKDNYDSEKCLVSLQEIVNQFPSSKVFPFFDAWGKFPSGIAYGNFYDIGNFDQCVMTSVNVSDLTGIVKGQFCFASIPLANPFASSQRAPVLEAPTIDTRRNPIDREKLNAGICVPDSCSPQFLELVFEKVSARVPHGALFDISVSRCTDGKKHPFEAINVIGIVFFSIIGGLMILSSIYDFLVSYFEKSPMPILLTFSVLTNAKKLFTINLERNPNTIHCLTGIRVLSMVWVIYCHTYMTSPHFPLVNTYYLISWYKSLWAMQVLHGTVSVDSFFFISGLLVAFLGFRELDRTHGKINVLMMYVHRYIRLTPVVGAILLFAFSINDLLYTGPFKDVALSKNRCDSGNFWPILLYISNYFRISTCFDQTWYLAVDFQLYVLSPLLLIPMWKWGKKFMFVLLALALMAIGWVMAVYISEGFTSLITGTYPEEWSRTYIPTHARCPPWLVGFALGYFMHQNRHNTIRPSRIVQLFGWIASLTILLVIVYGPYFTIVNHGYGTVLEAAFYEAWKRFAWAIGLSWIVFACHFGFGGVVGSFLSHPYWQPLGRLTFSLYLVHMTILRVNFGMMRSEFHFTDHEEILLFWGTFGLSTIAAIVVTLAFESPVLALEKIVFGRRKPERNTQIEQTLPHDTFWQMPAKDL